MNETTENFWRVWSEFKWPELVVPSYRLYYNDDGTPKCYSMDVLPDKYIEVDAETFACRPWNVKVIDQKLVSIRPPITVSKLEPNDNTGICCHPHNVCVVVDQTSPHTKWNIATREIN